MVRPRVLLTVGYFDWFSGYQETALASAFAKIAETEVLASDRKNPTFSDSHLQRLGLARHYQSGSRCEHGVTITRFPCWEMRSMVWSTRARRYIASRPYDLILQVMPGQLFPIAASLTSHPAARAAMYGDNSAMWADLPILRRALKGLVFSATKGLSYAIVNRRCARIFGYTPATLRRLSPFRSGRTMELMPLVYSPDRFYFREGLRRVTRERLGYDDRDIVVLGVGKFERRKRLDWLIGAFEASADKERSLRLLLVGADDSEAAEETRRISHVSRHRDRIQIRGFADAFELNATFNASDVAVWPRHPAITIQQAMGTGLFVVLPLNDLVGHLSHPEDGTGLYYSPRSGLESRLLSDALTYAIRSTDFSVMARIARIRANRWLSADALAADLLTTIERRC
jgi:glycosyltransferase involved in cell wall biosynthesis